MTLVVWMTWQVRWMF